MVSNYDDPEFEERWCAERQAEAAAYLQQQCVAHARIGEWPAWHVVPYVSLWAIESLRAPGSVGWWVINGDLPTDYVSAEMIKHPREAVRAIAERWFKAASCMARGQESPGFSIGRATEWPTLAPMLKSRAKVLAEWANDESIWQENAP